MIFFFMCFSLSCSCTRHLTLAPSHLISLTRPREHLRWYRQADLLGCREIHYELVARPTGSANGSGNFLESNQYCLRCLLAALQ